jgi:hypothetical protein
MNISPKCGMSTLKSNMHLQKVKSVWELRRGTFKILKVNSHFGNWELPEVPNVVWGIKTILNVLFFFNYTKHLNVMYNVMGLHCQNKFHDRKLWPFEDS